MTAPSIISVAAPALATATDTATVTYPSSMVFGDIVLATLFVDAGLLNTITAYDPGSNQDFTFLYGTASGVRRGVAVYYRYVLGNEGASGVINVTTSAVDASIGSCAALVRTGFVGGNGLHSQGSAGITLSTTPSPADIITTVDESLAVACVAYENTGTIGAIAANSWAEAAAEQNNTSHSFSFQSVQVPTAATISGGSATLGTIGNHGCISLAIKPHVNLFLPQAMVIG